jgi:hypothetical protein
VADVDVIFNDDLGGSPKQIQMSYGGVISYSAFLHHYQRETDSDSPANLIAEQVPVRRVLYPPRENGKETLKDETNHSASYSSNVRAKSSYCKMPRIEPTVLRSPREKYHT